jgi:Zn-dependent peptidase ImmA (M78 family)
MTGKAGFVKSHVNVIAVATRTELGLGKLDPMNPLLLADFLEIPVLGLSSLQPREPAGVNHFLTEDPNAFSAVTVFDGPKRLIVHNDTHAPGRQASNIAHELSHGLLQHAPTPALNSSGCRDWDQVVEDEAQWLAGALLITEDAAVWSVRKGLDIQQIADQFGVSVEMARWRVNMTGAVKRASRRFNSKK